MSAPLQFLLQGAAGRMGQAILSCAAHEPSRFACRRIALRGDAIDLEGCDAAIEFSSADALDPILGECRVRNVPLVIGATGHSEEHRAAIKEASAEVAIVFAANFSVGVNTLFWLTRKTAQVLGGGFDIEVVEMHHRLKKDAPSGTARRLAEIASETVAGAEVRDGRSGLVGPRRSNEIGVHAVRGGDVVGEHTVFFAGTGERLELTHRASSRDTFALGALRAAEWLRGRKPGLYDMEDVLGLPNV